LSLIIAMRRPGSSSGLSSETPIASVIARARFRSGAVFRHHSPG
jgi:hypothetical protein